MTSNNARLKGEASKRVHELIAKLSAQFVGYRPMEAYDALVNCIGFNIVMQARDTASAQKACKVASDIVWSVVETNWEFRDELRKGLVKEDGDAMDPGAVSEEA
jgi:hypothetical protein